MSVKKCGFKAVPEIASMRCTAGNLLYNEWFVLNSLNVFPGSFIHYIPSIER